MPDHGSRRTERDLVAEPVALESIAVATGVVHKDPLTSPSQVAAVLACSVRTFSV